MSYHTASCHPESLSAMAMKDLRRTVEILRPRGMQGLRMTAAFCFALLLLSLPAQAVEYVSPQTVGPTLVLNAVAVPTASAIVPDQGQSVHYVTYTTAGAVTQLSIQIEASDDGTNFVRISETASDTTAGCVFAAVYKRFIRLNLTTMAGGGTITAYYTGTSVGAGPPAGCFATSGTNQKTLANGLPADTTQSFDIDLPAGGTGGVLYFTFSAGGYGGATIQVSAGPDTSHLDTTLGATVLAAVATTQSFLVPNRSANVARVTYTTAGATALTYDLSYAFGTAAALSTVQVEGLLPDGALVVTSNPVIVGGVDTGGFVQQMLVNTGGGQVIAGNFIPTGFSQIATAPFSDDNLTHPLFISKSHRDSSGSNFVPDFWCDQRANISVSASGNTQIIAAVGGDIIYVCNLAISWTAGSAVDFSLHEGIGANCGTGDTAITGTYQDINSVTHDYGPWGALRTTVSQALCVNMVAGTNATGGGVIIYAQF